MPEAGEKSLQRNLQIDSTLKCLALCQRHQIDPDAEIITLPQTHTKSPSSAYQVLEDQETDHRNHLVEVKIDGERLELFPGDTIIRSG